MRVPFVGPSVLQVVMGTIAVVLGALAWHARRTGAWSHDWPYGAADRPAGSDAAGDAGADGGRACRSSCRGRPAARRR